MLALNLFIQACSSFSSDPSESTDINRHADKLSVDADASTTTGTVNQLVEDVIINVELININVELIPDSPGDETMYSISCQVLLIKKYTGYSIFTESRIFPFQLELDMVFERNVLHHTACADNRLNKYRSVRDTLACKNLSNGRKINPPEDPET